MAQPGERVFSRLCLTCPPRGTGSAMANKKTSVVAKLKDVLAPDEPTKTELYAKARSLGVKGRSKMNKGALKSAVNRSK